MAISQSKKLSLFFLNISFLCLLCFYLIKSSNFPTTTTTDSLVSKGIVDVGGCTGVHDYTDYKSQCKYVKSHIGCKPKGYINYLQIFYCTCGNFPLLGHFLLLLWLVVLFYLLGNTAANYFCSSLENLSRVLKLPPTIAGVTLLSLGNGAADVFASIVSFTKSGDGDVGLNSILGGAFFVSSAVVGVICIVTSPRHICVDKPSFLRDILFFLFSLFALLLIIFIGKINLLGAVSFVSIYFIYVLSVSAIHFYQKHQEKSKSFIVFHSQDDFGFIGIPLLGYVDEEKPVFDKIKEDEEDHEKGSFLWRVLSVLELPLYLPRRMTIPVITEENWSKPYAVISVTLAPILLATLCNTQRDDDIEKGPSRTSLVIYMVSVLIAMVLGNLAYLTTKSSSPPKRCLFPWLAGGFFMSVTWTYMTAEELVSLLVSIGNILGISPSVLGLTVLAWGNSLGDLIANVAMAVNGGSDGAQIAISGCYAGPMFNTLVGLGVSLVFSSSSEYPKSYVIPLDSSLYETLGFLMAGLLWALVILPRKNMKLDRLMGFGLLAIYFCFLFLRLARVIGLLN